MDTMPFLEEHKYEHFTEVISTKQIGKMSNVFKALSKEAKARGLQEPTLDLRMVGYEAKIRIGNKKWTSKVQYSSGKATADAARQALSAIAAPITMERQQQPVQTNEQGIVKGIHPLERINSVTLPPANKPQCSAGIFTQKALTEGEKSC